MSAFPGRPAALLALLLISLSLPASPADSAASAHQVPIVHHGEGPYYRLTLPTTIYPGAAHPDLRDVRIRNAEGHWVPYAWIANETTETQLQSRRAAIYPLSPNRPDNVTLPGDMTLSFRQNADGSLLLLKTAPHNAKETDSEWIIDASQSQGCLLQARFVLAENTEGLFPLSLEASDDLRQWRTISRNEQLAVLKRANQKIERLALDLGGIRAKYLRLRWRDSNAASEILSVDIDSVLHNEVITPMQWSAPIAATACGEKHCDYLLPTNTPLDSLRIVLSEPNSLASVTTLGQITPQNSRPSHHHRNPLYVLRHKRPASAENAASTQWRPLAQTVAYRLKLPNGEIRSDDLALGGGLYPRLRLQTSGPITLLGQTPPLLEVGSVPRSLVFLGRGSPPFTLQWGADSAQGQAIPLATLIPAYRPDTPITAGNATVDIPSPVAQPVVSREEPPNNTKSPESLRKWGLWAALSAGLALLAGMAWSLFRNIDQRENAKPQNDRD